MIKKYSVAVCLLLSALLLVVAASQYPGGSLFDKHSEGFQWSKNFLSNLFQPVAFNGLPNPGRIWALWGMAFHSVGYGLFFIHSAAKLVTKGWSVALRYIGFANIVFIFLLATPYHDVGTISIVLTLMGLFVITVFVFPTKQPALITLCVVCLVCYYAFFLAYGLGYLPWAMILQKVYVAVSLITVVCLEYFFQKNNLAATVVSSQKTVVRKS
ncbi:MAG: hypothetical protein EAY72_02835 [Bacteroidetes bacterium]|nr:MAG: hypothetical protein EAY72_02835 [Bacteroidota bacterium]TAE71036.1 MAG: hypothetical protein EAY68_02210 [Bacteroidota bacterium]